MPSLLVSDNVFRVSASVRTFVELQNVLHLFEQQTQSVNLERCKENDAKLLKKHHRFDGAWQIWTEPLFQNGGVSLGQV